MPRVKLTIKESKCRSGYHKKGDVFIHFIHELQTSALNDCNIVK